MLRVNRSLYLGPVATDAILTDGRFLDVRPIRVCFARGLKERSRIPVLDVFWT